MKGYTSRGPRVPEGEEMDQATWDGMTYLEQEAARDWSELSPQLEGLEGWRVEVVDKHGETRRFIVGRSTGWKPIHLEVKTRRSLGGGGANREYTSVRKIYFAR